MIIASVVVSYVSTHNLQGVPEKTLVSVLRLLEALKNELQIKVG